jgi:hypothetical protein
VYSSDAVAIPHRDFLELRRQGRISLGIDQFVAKSISESPALKPTKTSAAAAYDFWTIVGVGGFLFTIYLSFTSHWWWFLVGLVGGGAIIIANDGSNQRNLLDAAMVDRDFYEKVRSVRGWEYKMHADDAEPYLTHSYLQGRKAGEERLRQNSVTK